LRGGCSNPAWGGRYIQTGPSIGSGILRSDYKSNNNNKRPIKRILKDSNMNNEVKEPELRRSERIAKSMASPLYTFHTEPRFKHLKILKIIISRNYRQATRTTEWNYWKKAEEKEIEGTRDAEY
jgi:cellulose biosynthesis protein BcsQ